ncbi:monofunctional chorismate mutase, clade 1 [Sphaerochaeta pleomorpha str. Grapes]|uniref:chorismate mutase n=1 Tax=Sphaerochaeta pleomorpha (strain ATCC BAA-1885 / DSM 22778 / Grapes) TaxID=158190 RepID=G8QW62_SPHPG|nr:chorismate mutase [Sphaerochaeta pleomorpha]AEV28305.1 monofunctional chorismate mutase, clade 1 [Sphaerochaeta pleomorpha str. Grapes]
MNNPMIHAIRGAICVQEDTKEAIDHAICKLFSQVLEANGLLERDIAFLLMTQTGDLKSRNPAAGLRSGGFCATTPLFCMQELEIDGMLERVIRIMLVANREMEKVVPVYTEGAEKLRPDLTI